MLHSPVKKKILAIDAANITRGGGLTHLIEILKVCPEQFGFKKIILFANKSTLDYIEDSLWIDKKPSFFLNNGLLLRMIWYIFILKKELRTNKCNILFNPGGGYIGKFHPYITMCRNMLVFDKKERARYKYDFTYWRLILLERIQTFSFKNADGIIFVSNYARNYVSKEMHLKIDKCTTIPHGVSNDFNFSPFRLNDERCKQKRKFQFLYISIIDVYKHQWQLVKAFEKLCLNNEIEFELILVGPAYPKAYKLFKNSLIESQLKNIKYIGEVNKQKLKELYENADAFVFLSSCENMPNILIEAMRAGLPILCSNKSSMKEFLKDAGWYCDPEDVESIYIGLQNLLESSDRRLELATKAANYANSYNWEKCRLQTFTYLNSINNEKCVAY